MRNGQLTRVLSLYRALYAERRTLASLAKDFSVTTRTVRRDIEALEDAGFGVAKSCEIDDVDDAQWAQTRQWWIEN